MSGKRTGVNPSRRNEKLRTARILGSLRHAYPRARCALNHKNALELLVATILSAQCTDERVNKVTESLFERYLSPEDYLRASQESLESDIRPTGFFRNKARSIQGACRMIVDEFGGRVPETMEDLIRLPGVARKTANVVLGVVFGKAEGIVVDTHVFRIAHRLELSRAKSPEKVEADLMAIIPRPGWIDFSHQVIQHGRRVCKARRPLCDVCAVERDCGSDEKSSGLAPAGRRSSSGRKGGE